MNVPNRIFILSTLAVLGIMVLSACGAGAPAATPTLSVGAIQTAAVGTFSAGLTQTALAMPTNTPTNTPTFTPTATSTVATPLATAVPTSSCYNLAGVKDVTIPDNTPVTPGQTFIKTWLVKNSGTCNWEVGFKFSLVGGDAMGGQTLVLDKTVAPGVEMELSIPMTAPTNKTGPVRGDWRMSTASGAFFGADEYVIVVVGGTAVTATATTAAPTATPTSTSTP